MNAKTKNFLKYSISLVLAAACVWLVVQKVDWKSFLEGLTCTRWGYIALFVAASIGALVFRTERWRDLLAALGGQVGRLSVWDAINVGNLVNVALPGAGELLRCGLVTTKKTTYDKAFGTILMERICDILAIVVIVALALALKWKDFSSFFTDSLMAGSGEAKGISGWWWTAAAVIVCGLFIWAAFHFRKKSKLMGKIADSISGVAQGIGSFMKMEHKLRFISYTAGLWFMYILMSWFGLKAVPALEHLTFVDALIISAIGNLAAVIPVPSGMGPYHYLVMTTLTGLYACDAGTGLLYAVLCHESHAILVIVLGVISYVVITLAKRRNDVQNGQDRKYLPNDVLLGEAESLMQEGHEVAIIARGNSMLPFIRSDIDTVILRDCHGVADASGEDGATIGDIVLAKFPGGTYILHRLIRIDGDIVTLRGDGNLRGVEHCRANDICAMAVCISRPSGKTIDCTTQAFKRRARIWWRIPHIIRRVYLAFYRRLCGTDVIRSSR